MKTQSNLSWLSAGVGAALIAFAPYAAAERAKPAMVEAKAAGKVAAELSLDAIVSKHLAALGGADLLRATRSMSYVSSGEKGGKKYTKTAHFARPGKMRIDFESDGMKGSKGFDGKVAWVKKGGEAAVAMSAEDTLAMKAHADFDEPLLDYARRGTAVKLLGTSEVAGTPAYELELTLAGGKVEHHFLDASTFLPLQITSVAHKDGKAVKTVVRLGDYRKVQGRMINHSIEFKSDGVTGRGAISKVAFDKPLDASVFAMPKK
jgi:outer membrane lipoprotein-sorting protein